MPKRPIGIFESMKAMWLGVIWSKMAVFTAAGVTQFTACSVSASSLPSDLVRRDQARLARAVGAGIGIAVLAGHRGDVDDAARQPCARICAHHLAAADEQAV